MADYPDTNGNPAVASKSNNNPVSHRDPSSSKHSPIAPLAPLEYLQTQRRGSITDPSLHAAPISSNMKPSTNYRQPPEQSGSTSASPMFHSTSSKNTLSDPRPSSPYVFGDATIQPSDSNSNSNSHSQLRKLLRSPSLDHNNHRPPSAVPPDSQGPSRSITASNNNSELQEMNVDSQRNEHQAHSHRSPRDSQPFDYNMRRHSVAGLAGPQPPHTLPHLSSIPHGTKRKMSVDRGVFPPVGEEIDPHLIGPGVPSGMDVDADAPAPKRRGSTFDTRSMAHLSLSDRRSSVDTRAGLPHLWNNERRDSTSSMFSNVSSVSGFNTTFSSNDSTPGRPPPGMANFVWQSNAHDQTTPNSGQNEGDQNIAGQPRAFDPSPLAGMMPPMNFDRRMSVPDLTSGPTRALRPRSRPPSSQAQNPDSNPASAPSSGPEDGAAPSPGTSSKAGKDSGTTPYSRSPELRVSHKLAERKRRKEMKDLFDELRDQLPADRGMKASKWEILSKAIDFVAQLKQSHQDMAREIDMMRHEMETLRQATNQSFSMAGTSNQPSLYGQAPGQYTAPPSAQSLPTGSRPLSSQNVFPPTGNTPQPAQNGNLHRPEG